MAGRRKSDDAYDNFGMRYEGWLDGKSMWPCMNVRGCSNKVDPDSAMQYCSKACENAVLTNKNGASGMSVARVQFAKAAQAASWVRGAQASGYIRRVDSPALNQPIDCTLSAVRRLEMPVRR